MNPSTNRPSSRRLAIVARKIRRPTSPAAAAATFLAYFLLSAPADAVACCYRSQTWWGDLEIPTRNLRGRDTYVDSQLTRLCSVPGASPRHWSAAACARVDASTPAHESRLLLAEVDNKKSSKRSWRALLNLDAEMRTGANIAHSAEGHHLPTLSCMTLSPGLRRPFCTCAEPRARGTIRAARAARAAASAASHSARKARQAARRAKWRFRPWQRGGASHRPCISISGR